MEYGAICDGSQSALPGHVKMKMRGASPDGDPVPSRPRGSDDATLTGTGSSAASSGVAIPVYASAYDRGGDAYPPRRGSVNKDNRNQATTADGEDQPVSE